MKNIKNEIKMEFLSKSANEAFARITIAAFASQLDPTIEEIADIKTSVSEAVTNAIIHAYPNKEGIVKLKGILYDDNEIHRPKQKRNTKPQKNECKIKYSKSFINTTNKNKRNLHIDINTL